RFGEQEQHFLFAAQVEIDRSGGEVRLERDLLDGRLMKRFTREHAARREKDLTAPRFSESVVGIWQSERFGHGLSVCATSCHAGLHPVERTFISKYRLAPS